MPALSPWPVSPHLGPVADAIQYDAVNRSHRLIDRPVLSVTQLLARAAALDVLAPERKERYLTLEGRSAAAQRAIKARGELGTRVHLAAHFSDEDDLVRESVWSEAQPYLEAWEAFREARRFTPELLETVVASYQHHYIGRFDRLGRVQGDPHLVLLDIKTGDPDHAAADLQLAGYLQALLESNPVLTHRIVADVFPSVSFNAPTLLPAAFALVRRWCVQLLPDRTPPFKVHVYPRPGRSAEMDRQEFLALVREVNHRETGGTNA